MSLLRRLRQVATIDGPWAISNWLWANILTPLLTGLRRLTLRRIVYLTAFLVFALAMAELYLPADVALMLAGDSALYFEIMTFAYIALVRARLHRAVVPVTRMAWFALRRTVSRVTARARRTLRLPRLFDDADDVPDGAFA